MDDQMELPARGDNIIRTYDIVTDPDYIGLGHKLFWSLKKHKDVVAQIDGATGDRDTYAALLTKCVRAAIEMRKRGVKPGDVVMPCTSNHLNTCVPFVAALFLGARVASLDPSLAVADMSYLIGLTRPKLIFASPNAVDSLEEALDGDDEAATTDVVVFGSDGGFDEFLNPSDEEATFEPVRIGSVLETALIYFTSGSTGAPKGICINHESILARITDCLQFVFSPKVMLNFSPLYWMSAMYCRVTTMIAGGTFISAAKFSPDKAFQYFEEYDVTDTFLAVTESVALLKHNPSGNVVANLPALECVMTGGSSISSENISGLRRLFCNARLLFIYGQTEIFGMVCAFHRNARSVEMMVEKANSVGRPLRGLWYKVVDPETDEVLGPNETGELRLKTRFIMNGYYDLDSSSAWDSDGWFKTGDLCYYDDDHCFYIVERLKELIKYKGWHVAPIFIEDILLQHPAVKTAIVIGIPDERHVELAMGLVELREHAAIVTAEELVEYVSKRTGDETKNLHGGIRFVSDIPYSPSGKVRRNALKNKILAEIAQES